MNYEEKTYTLKEIVDDFNDEEEKENSIFNEVYLEVIGIDGKPIEFSTVQMIYRNYTMIK